MDEPAFSARGPAKRKWLGVLGTPEAIGDFDQIVGAHPLSPTQVELGVARVISGFDFAASEVGDDFLRGRRGQLAALTHTIEVFSNSVCIGRI